MSFSSSRSIFDSGREMSRSAATDQTARARTKDDQSMLQMNLNELTIAKHRHGRCPWEASKPKQNGRNEEQCRPCNFGLNVRDMFVDIIQSVKQRCWNHVNGFGDFTCFDMTVFDGSKNVLAGSKLKLCNLGLSGLDLHKLSSSISGKRNAFLNVLQYVRNAWMQTGDFLPANYHQSQDQ